MRTSRLQSLLFGVALTACDISPVSVCAQCQVKFESPLLSPVAAGVMLSHTFETLPTIQDGDIEIGVAAMADLSSVAGLEKGLTVSVNGVFIGKAMFNLGLATCHSIEFSGIVMPASQFATLLVNGSATVDVVPGADVVECLPFTSSYLLISVRYLNADCNNNGVDDTCDLNNGTSKDCNSTGVPDSCELRPNNDCNANLVPDECDVADGVSKDCNGDGVPDECEPHADCNANGIMDICDLASGTSGDCNDNGIPDDCERNEDCNKNGTSDICDIGRGSSSDGNLNQIPDECEPDCNANGLPDESDIVAPALGLNLALPNGDVPSGLSATVFAEGLVWPRTLAVSTGGAYGDFLYVEETTRAAGAEVDRVIRIDTDGAQSEFVSLIHPNGLTFGQGGVFDAGLYIANGSIYVSRFTEFGVRTDVAGPLLGVKAVTFGFRGLMYVSNGADRIVSFDAAGTQRTVVDTGVFTRSTNVIAGRGPFTGFLYVIDEVLDTMFRISPSGETSVFVPSFLATASDMAFGSGGAFGTDLYVTSWHNILRIDPLGNVTVFGSGFDNRLQGIAFGHGGVFGHDMYVVQSLKNRNGRILRIAQPRSQDCNTNGIPDECDIASGFSADDNANGIPDECCSQPTAVPVTVSNDSASPVTLSSNRFLTFSIDGIAQRKAVRVTFEDLPAPFDIWNGSQMWVGAPSAVSQHGGSIAPVPGVANFTAASLSCEPFFAPWSDLGPIHVFHEGIVPGGTYSIDVVDANCDMTIASNFSQPLELTTGVWGDTIGDTASAQPGPPDGSVAIADALTVIRAFSGTNSSASKTQVDLEPGCLDLKINISDALSALAGFQGLHYPFAPSASDPCNSTCTNPLP